MRAVWSREASKFDNIMFWEACFLCYFGFLRLGEATVPCEAAYNSRVHLNVNDVFVDNLANPTVAKKLSKTDQFRKGVDIYVGWTRNALCPVEAMLAYIARRGTGEGPLFKFEDGRLLTKDRFVKGVREALTKAGVNIPGTASGLVLQLQLGEEASLPKKSRHLADGKVRPTCSTSDCREKSWRVSLRISDS
jgi:hypothetical protein